MPEVTATLVLPNLRRVPLTLRKITNGEREGFYSEQFIATMTGDYRIDLAPPYSEEELLQREVRVRLPENEFHEVKRNDAVLRELAERTGRTYNENLETLRDFAAT